MNEIDRKIQLMGRKASLLGSPVGRTQTNTDGKGQIRKFQNGAICWHPELGAFAVLGPIHAEWFRQNHELGPLGYPTSDQLSGGDGRMVCSCFKKGRIYYTDDKGILTTDLLSDKGQLQWSYFNAKPLPADYFDHFKEYDGLPAKIDYEADVNFTRNQGTMIGGGFGGHGCMVYALMHIIDILKDWEHPYTPAVSWHYFHWWWLKFVKDNNGECPTLNQTAKNGMASEGLCHSNEDTEYKEQSGKSIWEEPFQISKDEVPLYRASMVSEPHHLCKNHDQDIEAIKWALHSYGPVWCAGCGHAKAIIGYDDSTQMFKILNSYPEEPGGHNIAYYSYNTVGGDIAEWSEVKNIPSILRTTGRYAYTARIRVEGVWRGTYTVSIGVEGHEPLVVWTTRGRHLQGDSPLEHSRFLAIDVPLPDYAKECWPPSSSHRWVLRVEDNDKDGLTGRIREFTLARRFIHPYCHSIGHFQTETFGGQVDVHIPDPANGPDAPGMPTKYEEGVAWPAKTPNQFPGVATVTVPAPGTILPPKKHDLAHSISLKGNVIIPSEVDLTGELVAVLNANKPAAGQEVCLYEMKMYMNDNKPAKWVLLQKATTDSKGCFAFKVTLSGFKQRTLAAAYKMNKGEALASSEMLLIKKQLPHKEWETIRIRDWSKVIPPDHIDRLPVDIRALMMERM